jgi:hypothetical protein
MHGHAQEQQFFYLRVNGIIKAPPPGLQSAKITRFFAIIQVFARLATFGRVDLFYIFSIKIF